MTVLTTQLVSFTIDEQRLAIPIPVVERIERAVEITKLGKAPETILGVIDYHGEIIPVLNLRKRLGFPERALTPSDRFMIIRTSTRKIVLVADEMREVIPASHARIAVSGIIPESVEAQGLTRCSDGLVLIYDPEKFLSSSEEFDLAQALMRGETRESPHKDPSSK